jgi:predicted O-linked N-acetylglucosamine transferase (SPINDLY family)
MNAPAQFARSIHLLTLGNLDAAETLCREIVRSEPRHADALHVLGIINIRRGRPEAGLQFMQRSLALDPARPHVHCNLGNALCDLKQPEAALASYRNAIRLEPNFAGARYGEGNALMVLNRPQEALASFDAAIALQADYADAYQNRGNALLSLGLPEQALESFRLALKLHPHSAMALGNCGYVLRLLQRHSEALEIYSQLAALYPGDAEALICRGNLLLELGRHEEAIESFDRALQRLPNASDTRASDTRMNRGNAWCALKQFERGLNDYDEVLRNEPNWAEAHCYRGHGLFACDRFEEALSSFNEAARLKPRFVDALNGSGMALQALKRFDEARAAFEEALIPNPEVVDILYRLAVCLRHLDRHAQAAEVFARVVALAPDYDYALGNMQHERVQVCDWTHYSQTLAAVEQSLIRGGRAYLPGPFFAVSDSSAAQAQCARIFVADKLPESAASYWSRPAIHHDKIRIAYVSADFREHPVSHLIAGVLEAHDRRRFEVTGVSLQPQDHSAAGQRVRRAFHQFIDVSRASDRDVSALMRDLEIDIAIDLMGFSGGSRPAIFANRAAPIQVNYLGFSGTLGARWIDYIIADRVVIPPSDEAFFTEKIAYLPHCFQPNDHKRRLAERRPNRAECGLPDGAFVFCAFHGPYKISPVVFDIWMRLLGRIEGSVLWLPLGGESVIGNLRREAAARGIGQQRLVFAPRLPEVADHLARYALADLFLDTLPYNAHTTASDALWAGLPVLSCRGGSFAGRVAASLLTVLGLPELVASTLTDYETQAYRLATTPSLLAELRTKLAQQRSSSPLFDSERYCRDLESAYITMWKRFQAGQAPQNLTVNPIP